MRTDTRDANDLMRDQQDASRPECRDLSELGAQIEAHPVLSRMAREGMEMQRAFDESRRRDG